MGAVRTVCGDIPDDRLGVTMAHEHLCCDFSLSGGSPDNCMRDWELIATELQFYKRSGGAAVFEVTPCDMGSDPEALRRISAESGVHIVHGISFYREDRYPDWVRAASAESLAEFFASRIEDGVQGVRCGLIGEIGSHNEPEPDPKGYRLREDEAKVFRAAALAQRTTGAAISTHASLGRAGHAQLDVLEAAGADLSRVAIGHCDAHGHDDEKIDLEYYLPILQRGAYVQFDLIGWNREWSGIPSDALRARRLATLIARGCASQLLLSSDTCRLSQLQANGGRGYDHVLTQFVPRLRSLGVAEEAIEMMLVKNPRRFVSLRR